MELLVGVDIGGTRTKVVAVRRASTLTTGGDPGVVAEQILPTPTDVASRFVEHVRRAVGSAIDRAGPSASVRAVGVVVPGLVEDRTGTGVWSANLGWRGLPLARLVGEAVGPDTAVGYGATPEERVQVAVGHDVRAGLVGEHRFGAARGRDEVLFVPLGTGVASALMVGGRIVSGSPWAGELGHVVVDPHGARCGCGARGCLETVAGAGALARRWRELTGEDGDAQVLAAQAAQGEQRAVQLWEAAVAALAGVLAPVVAATGTGLVLVGGGLANAGDQLLDPLTTALQARLPERFPVEVMRAGLADRAAALGAVALAADALDAAPDRPQAAATGQQASGDRTEAGA